MLLRPRAVKERKRMSRYMLQTGALLVVARRSLRRSPISALMGEITSFSMMLDTTCCITLQSGGGVNVRRWFVGTVQSLVSECLGRQGESYVNFVNFYYLFNTRLSESFIYLTVFVPTFRVGVYCFCIWNIVVCVNHCRFDMNMSVRCMKNECPIIK